MIPALLFLSSEAQRRRVTRRVRAGLRTHGRLPSCKASEVSAAPGSQGRSLRLGLGGGCEMELPSPGRAHIHQAGDPSVPALCGV